MSACSNKEEESSGTTSTLATPGISMVNVSDVSTSDLESRAAAAAKMKNQTANILSVSWNVGAEVSANGFNRPYNNHQVVISDAQIESLMTSIFIWFDTRCMDSGTKSEELINF